MKTMSNKSLESHIEGISKQITEIGTMPMSAFKGGTGMVQRISKSLVDLKTIYEKELASRIAK